MQVITKASVIMSANIERMPCPIALMSLVPEAIFTGTNNDIVFVTAIARKLIGNIARNAIPQIHNRFGEKAANSAMIVNWMPTSMITDPNSCPKAIVALLKGRHLKTSIR